MNTADFVTQFPLRSYTKGQVILSEDETVEMLLFVTSGFVKVTSLDNAGSEHMLWIASGDDIVPSEHFFSLHNKVSYFYTALSPVKAHLVNKAELLSEARKNPSIMTTIAASLSDNYDDLLLRIDAIDQSNIHDRLITTLRYLALRFGSGKMVDLHQINLPLTHQDIAEMIGSTRETTSLELEKLRSNGTISYSRSSFVIYADKLIV
jgi:CRP/FNR family transcriptional regulator